MTVTTCGAGQVRVPLPQVLASKLVFEDGLAGEVSTVPRRGSGAARQPSETTHAMASAMTRRSARANRVARMVSPASRMSFSNDRFARADRKPGLVRWTSDLDQMR
jgi:hypothetical protein